MAKITKKDLVEWSEANETIRYRGELYKVRHQGLTAAGKPNGYSVKTRHYFLMPVGIGCGIPFRHKGGGVYGLISNVAQ